MTIKVMAIHIAPDCNMNPHCPFCYMDKEKPSKSLEWFYDMPLVAKQLGIQQIAIGGGEPTLFPEFLEKFTKLCRSYDIIPNLTTNGINKIPKTILENLGCVSFSFDKYKASRVEWLDKIVESTSFNGDVTKLDYNKPCYHLLDAVDDCLQLKGMWEENNPKVGINYLMIDKQSVYMLSKVIKHFLIDNKVDTLYALQMKNHKIDYTREDLKKVLYPLSLLLGDRLCVDDSVLMSLGKLKQCHRGREFISIDYHGNVKPCSFSEPIAKIDKISDLIQVVKNNYPMQKCTKCEYIK